MKKYFVLLLFMTASFGFTQQIEYINSTEHLKRKRPFSQATVVNNMIYLSGQIGTLPNGTLVQGGIEAETQQVMTNIKTLLESMGSNLNQVIKCSCMLEDIKDWSKMSAVYATFFDKSKLPARSAFAGSGLALGAKVEIECMALRSTN